MKTNVLLRHGKSDWDAGVSSDHDRPLTSRGTKGAGLTALMPEGGVQVVAGCSGQTDEATRVQASKPTRAVLDDVYESLGTSASGLTSADARTRIEKYGRNELGPDARESAGVTLGNISLRGERGALKIGASDLRRLRWNPFYAYLEARVREAVQ